MKKIDQMYAFVAIDPNDGDEGVVAAPVLDGLLTTPLVGADMDRVDSLRPIAQQMADAFGVNIEIRHFSNVEVLGTIEPTK